MLSEKIKELRLSLGLNQPQLAQKLGVSKQCISNWENGYIQPSLDMVYKLVKLFSVSSDYLLGLSEKRSLDITGLSNEQIENLTFLVKNMIKE